MQEDIQDMKRRLDFLENTLFKLADLIDDNRINAARFRNMEIKFLDFENKFINKEIDIKDIHESDFKNKVVEALLNFEEFQTKENIKVFFNKLFNI